MTLRRPLDNGFLNFQILFSPRFQASSVDYSVFTNKQDQLFLPLVVYLYDIIVAGNDLVAISNHKDFLN